MSKLWGDRQLSSEFHACWICINTKDGELIAWTRRAPLSGLRDTHLSEERKRAIFTVKTPLEQFGEGFEAYHKQMTI